MKNPLAITCRAHSGGRILSDIYEQAGIQMGSLFPKTKDTIFFSIRKNNIVKELILKSGKYPDFPPKRVEYFKRQMQTCIDQYVQQEIKDTSKPYGWKFGETIFILPYLFDIAPNARVIHLIRDGRDVMLSRIPARFDDSFHDPFNKRMIFGKASQLKYKGEVLKPEVIDNYRTELELIHWQTVIEFSKRLRVYQNQYMEVRYEDLCQNPKEVLNTISEFIEVPFDKNIYKWAVENISASRIAKWKKEDINKIKEVSQIAESTLREYGYWF